MSALGVGSWWAPDFRFGPNAYQKAGTVIVGASTGTEDESYDPAGWVLRDWSERQDELAARYGHGTWEPS